MWQLPREMYAEISRWLPNDDAGAIMRLLAGNVIIKEIRNGNTYANGLLHSFSDEPAMINYNNKYWYKFGKKHRIDGPAVINSDGIVEYYLHD